MAPQTRTKKTPFIAAGVLLFALIGSIFFFTKEKLDQNYCATDTSKQGVTVLLIDASDELSEAQKAGLTSELRNLTSPRGRTNEALLNKGDRLAVYLLGEDQNDLERIFNMCNPGSLNERTFSEKASEGDIYAGIRWETFSQGILKEVNQKIRKATSNQTSPLIETIKHIQAAEFLPSDVNAHGREFRLVVVSDFLQNSGIATHYGRLPDVRTVFKRVPVDFGNAEVRMWLLKSRSHLHLQNGAHTAWWRSYFALANAKLRQEKAKSF